MDRWSLRWCEQPSATHPAVHLIECTKLHSFPFIKETGSLAGCWGMNTIDSHSYLGVVWARIQACREPWNQAPLPHSAPSARQDWAPDKPASSAVTSIYCLCPTKPLPMMPLSLSPAPCVYNEPTRPLINNLFSMKLWQFAFNMFVSFEKWWLHSPLL